MTEPPSLSEYASTTGTRRRRGYLDGLPDEIRAQVARSYIDGIPATTVAAWLRSIGYEEASQTMVCRWRRDQATKGSPDASG
jgi:hypothetical protein